MGLDTSNQLQSINEEGESMDGHQVPTAAHLGRNTPGRQSKEFTAKLHKVSFPNFKKLKDKESKSKTGATAAGIPMNELGQGGKQQPLQQDSQSFMASTSAPVKRASILKDKLINRSSASHEDSAEKATTKLKNLSLDAAMGVGGANLGVTSSFDLIESNSADILENSIATRPSILPLDKSHSNGSGSNSNNMGTINHINNGNMANSGASNGSNGGNIQVYHL